MLEVPAHLRPTYFARAYGATPGRRFFALYWQPIIGLAFYDGLRSSLPMSLDLEPWRDWLSRPEVGKFCLHNGINLGSKGWPAVHWLVVDQKTDRVWLLFQGAGRQLVRTQCWQETMLYICGSSAPADESRLVVVGGVAAIEFPCGCVFAGDRSALRSCQSHQMATGKWQDRELMAEAAELWIKSATGLS